MGFFFRSQRQQGKSRRASQNNSRVGAGCERLEDRLLLSAVTLIHPSSNGGDGTWVHQQRQGTEVHVGPAYLYYNINPVTAFPGFQSGDTLYAQVNYFDEGSGYLKVQYDSIYRQLRRN